jgi:hypothetical protein
MVFSQPHPFRDPIESMPTNIIRLSPDFLAQLRGLAKRKKARSKSWVFFALILVAVGIAFAVPSSRTALVSHGRDVVAHFVPRLAAAPEAAVVREPARVGASLVPSSHAVALRSVATTIVKKSKRR